MQRDIPGQIARWLFRIGFIWAVILIPCFIVALSTLPSLQVFAFGLVVYILAGYSVWIGWRWRSHQRRTLQASVAFWLISALFNGVFVIWFIATTPASLEALFHFDALHLWWGIAASICSLVALYYELTQPKNDNTLA